MFINALYIDRAYDQQAQIQMSTFHRILSATLQLKSAARLMHHSGKENEMKETATKLINASLGSLLSKGQGQRERSDLLGKYRWIALEYPKKALSILRYERCMGVSCVRKLH